MKSLLILGTLLLTGSYAFANGLSGLYAVSPGNHCDLQAGTKEKIDVSTSTATMSLDLTGYAPASQPFQVIFSANIGDQITHPPAQFAKMGAQTVRVIASVSSDLTAFESNEYRYAADVSDAAGLYTGHFMTIRLKADTSGVQYEKIYSSQESFQCHLVRLP